MDLNGICHKVSKKGTWTKEEDKVLTALVNEVGLSNWILVAKSLPGRIGKQCRERWYKCLDPNISKKNWTPEEDVKIVRLYYTYGNKWSKISKEFCGRTDNSIKNRFNSNISKRLHEEIFKQIQNEILRKRDAKLQRKHEESFCRYACSSESPENGGHDC